LFVRNNEDQFFKKKLILFSAKFLEILVPSRVLFWNVLFIFGLEWREVGTIFEAGDVWHVRRDHRFLLKSFPVESLKIKATRKWLMYLPHTIDVV
jgi:hypothetical protein